MPSRRTHTRQESGHAEAVWRDQQAGFLSRVAGPHFESICRSFAMQAGSGLFGAPVGGVRWGQVMTPQHTARLARARDLLASHFDISDCALACAAIPLTSRACD